MSNVTLKGMTWNHPRGYDPMVAGSDLWAQKSGVSITWEKRSLQDFETFPVEELARNFDLIVIDHPHVGQITQEKCLLPLDVSGRQAEREALFAGSVGQSYSSYEWLGHQWAFPIDAATQVQAWRPDLMAQPACEWPEILELARNKRVIIPLLPPHSLMSFYTLCGNLGKPCNAEPDGDLFDFDTGCEAYERLCELAQLVDPACFKMDPIAVFEAMASEQSEIACSPLIYGYVNYAVVGFRPRLVRFADIARTGHHDTAGSALGGTGIAVSAFTKHAQESVDFAYWIASGAVQKGLYAASGGQPGHADAWQDAVVNEATTDFYRATRKTLEGSWVRPRHNGYMAFQQQASDYLNEAMLSRKPARVVVAELNRLYRQSVT